MSDPGWGQAEAERDLARAGLLNYLLWLQAEVRRASSALRALEGRTPGPARPQQARSGTFTLIRRYRDSFPPGGGPIKAEDAYRFLVNSGEWKTSARDPLGTVRTSLAHMAEPERGELDRDTETNGVYWRPRGDPARQPGTPGGSNSGGLAR